MGIPENKLTVIAPDVGGGFGSKIYHYGEEAVVLAAAKKLNRPVKWVAERSESFLSDAHGRDHVTTIQLATDMEGNFLALRTETLANVGAYLSNFSTATPTFLHGTLMAGPPTPRRSMPIAAQAAPRRPSRSSGSLTRRRASWGSTRSRSGARTSSGPTSIPTPRRSDWSMTPATTARHSTS